MPNELVTMHSAIGILVASPSGTPIAFFQKDANAVQPVHIGLPRRIA
jgi:hypothetical protein